MCKVELVTVALCVCVCVRAFTFCVCVLFDIRSMVCVVFPLQMSLERQQLQTAERTYSSQLAELQAMGFSNRQANLRGTPIPAPPLPLCSCHTSSIPYPP